MVAPPAAIAQAVRVLAHRLRHQRLSEALEAFGRDPDRPSSDLLVAAFTIASRTKAADLTRLPSRLAASILDDATMQIKVDMDRPRPRRSRSTTLIAPCSRLN